MINLINLLTVLAVIAIIIRCIYIAAHLSKKDFIGQRMRFCIMAWGYSITPVAALGMIAGWQYGPHLLAIGVAAIFMTERRLSGIQRSCH